VQDVIGVDHSWSWQAMRDAGRDVEKVVLARALNIVFHDSVFVMDNRTIIF
jgi:formyltetrahydrofolate deformylase